MRTAALVSVTNWAISPKRLLSAKRAVRPAVWTGEPMRSVQDRSSTSEHRVVDRQQRNIGFVVLLVLAVGLPVVRSAWFMFGPSLRLQQEFTDDTYYYALIAQNLANGQGSTFGGLVPTNGYQPLWQMMLVPLAAIADGDGFLRLVYGLVAALFAASVVLMWAIARRLKAERAGTYAIVFAVTVGLLAGSQFFNGMEIALVVPAILAFVWVALTRQPGRSTGIILGVLAVAVALGRLDAVAIPVVFGALTILRGNQAVRRTMVTAGVVLACGLAAYATINLAVFGTPVPISGQAKAVGGGSLGPTILTEYLTYGAIGPLPMYLGVQAVLLTTVALVLLRRGRVFSEVSDIAIRNLLLTCLIGQAAQITYFTVTSSFRFWPWYYYIVPVQLFLAVLVIAQVVLRSRPGCRLAAAPVVAAVACVGLLVGLGAFLKDPPQTDTWTAAAIPAVAWFDANTSREDVVAIGDRAGYFTWLTRRPTVQLEGLVQDPTYLPFLRERRIAEYMARAQVRYYVRSEETALGMVPTSSACTVAIEPLQGSGPKSEIPVCPADLVYRQTGKDFVWSVWRSHP